MRKSPINAGDAGGSFCFKRERCFSRAERLKRRNEIREVFSKGKRIGCRGAKLFVLKNTMPCNRICFTFSRNYGSAVKRNRARRLCREAYRHLKSSLPCGYDFILLVYPEDASFRAPTLAGRTSQLKYLFSRAGMPL